MLYNQDEPLLNGFPKKTLFLLTIEALLHNPRANLEFHLHYLISVLMKFVSCPFISTNSSDTEMSFREKSALLLACLINKLFYQF